MSDTQTLERPASSQPGLKRVMGPKLLLLFIVGDILGTGIYAVTGDVAAEVGGAVWVPFLVAFVVATITAFSYLELVTKYPHAAGAALYTHKAFGVHFLTFLVCFTVMCSGITSASTASRAFAVNLETMINNVIGWGGGGSEVELGGGATTGLAIGFMLLIAVINLRGVAESVYANIVLTCVELSGLLLVIFIGFFAFGQGKADLSRAVMFDTPEDKGVFLAVTAGTSLAFFAMVGFEDSVNMAEETKDPERVFPKIMLSGLTITGIIYVLVSISAVAIVPPGELGSGAPLLKVVQVGAPDLPFDQIFPLISMFAVSNSALINMLMASRLLYGMANQRVLPPVLGRVLPGRRTPWVAILFTSALACGLITFVGQISSLGGTTALLLLGVFTVVNICCLVLRRDPQQHRHFRAPTVLPIIGAVTCAYLVGPWTGRDTEQYGIAGVLLLIGIALWLVTWLINRAVYGQKTYLKDPEALEGPPEH
ncbi:amino acid transporter [Friedmanniella endophytica]|uniref:Amino acid transporter n=1 Tax=Microlunatus kandeliicorticis TaxID=1759536 RepID=A0A7W3P7P2_9ACTN|nr:APC family permease [Microlunatus kandeliicorticis]MBA8796243.1 amino acid transporter [Microlunatus kandeliicorticis]